MTGYYLEDMNEPLTISELEKLVEFEQALAQGGVPLSGAEIEAIYARNGGKPFLPELIDRLHIARQREERERQECEAAWKEQGR